MAGMPRRSGTRAWVEHDRGYDGRRRYRVRWIDPDTGKKESESCGTDSALARELLGQIMARLRLKRLGVGGDPTKRISDLVARLPELLAGRSTTSLHKMERSLNDLADVAGDRRLIGVDRDSIVAYRAKRLGKGLSPATVNGDLRTIKSALSYAADIGWIAVNPLLRWKGLFIVEPEQMVRVVEHAEFDRLIGKCNLQMRTALMLAYYAGLRRRELSDLRWDDVDIDNRSLLIRNRPEAGELTKSRKIRTVPMRDVLASELAAHRSRVPARVNRGRAGPKSEYVFCWEDGHPWNEDWLTHRFEEIALAAGVDCTLHDLRRSFSTLAQRAGVDRNLVKDLGGWSSVTVVERHYTGSIAPALRDAIARLDRQASAG